MEERPDRAHDVVVWGATGFTGQLVAEYLTKRYGVGRDLRWAIGGRDAAKLARVKSALAAIDPKAADLPVLVADAKDRAALDGIVQSTRVVASTVGPYMRYGRPLVAAAAAAGTDYCDLTGEPPFVRAIADAHQAEAEATGARIVPTCGFDSIPSDLGVLMVQMHARAVHGRPCREVRNFAGEMRGGFSGGTAASLIALLEEAAKDKAIRRVMGDPYSLVPGKVRGPDGSDPRGVAWDPDLGQWTGPFVMAAINARIVRRTNALLGHAWGQDFRYTEKASFGAGAKGLARAVGMTAGLAAFVTGTSVPALRKVIAARLPAPGEGPSREARENGFFVMRLLGFGEGEGGARFRVRGTVRGTSDPGYGETAKMLGESAVCLAKDHDHDGVERRGGVWTPASCMGERLIARLRAAGMTWDVRDEAV